MKKQLINKLKQIIIPIIFYTTFVIYDVMESYPKIHEDNRVQLLIPLELKLSDEQYRFYRELKVDWTIPPIKREDLPNEFSKKACKLVDLFRRKTINLNFECMLYFDYKTGEIIYCFIGEEDCVENTIDEFYFKNKHIASIHNHTNNNLYPPSPENFEILKIRNEEYELISTQHNLWILEAKGKYNEKFVKEFQDNITKIFNISIMNTKNKEFNIDELDKTYGQYLLKFIYNEKNKIKLTKKEF